MLKVNQIEKLSKVKTFQNKGIDKLIKVYSLKKNDNALIWTDTGNSIAKVIAKSINEKLNKIGCNVSVIVEKRKTTISLCSELTSSAILSLKKNDTFISISSNNRGRLSFERNFTMRQLMDKNGFKMVSMGGLGSIKKVNYKKFLNSFDHNEKEINYLNSKLKKEMSKTSFVHITCPLGTDLTLRIDKREIISNDGNWKEYSTNYPVGETYTSPIEDSVNGVAFVTSAKISGKTILPKKPIKFIFENGIVTYTNNSTLNKNLNYVELRNKEKKVPKYRTAPRTIAEFAIGTNSKASIVGAMICDEKVLGTCHFAIGNNKHLGGKNYCLGHFDNVINKPTIYFDGKSIMKKGKLVI